MNLFNRAAKRYLDKSQSALSEKRIKDAKRFAKKALTLNNSLVEAWLIMAATSEPDESYSYLQKVLEIDPQNTRAQKGITWVKGFLKDSLDNNSNLPAIKTRAIELLNQKENNKNNPFFRRLLSRWQSVLAMIAVLLIIIIAVAAPLIAPNTNSAGSPWFKVVCERITCFPEPPGY